MLGRVIGVNTQIQSDSGGSDGVGFAIPSNTVSSIVSQMVAGKTVQHAYLGISVSTSTSPPGAVLGDEVVAGTPAANAGLQPGDVIVKLDGKTIESGERPLERDRRQEAGRQARGDLRAPQQGAHRHGHARHAPLLDGAARHTFVTVSETSQRPGGCGISSSQAGSRCC